MIGAEVLGEVATKARTPRLVLRLKLGDGVLGPGKVELLETIDRRGSISSAAREMRMSYRQAWKLIETMNRKFREPVIRTAQGGRRGGGAALTPMGREVVGRYRAMLARVEKLAGKELRAIAAMTGRGR